MPSEEKQQEDIKNLSEFKKTLPAHLNPSQHYSKALEFMAGNGLRQLGEPRIGEFANRQRPEPVHNEINAWQHILNLIYKEALQRNVIDLFLEILSSPVDITSNGQVKLSPTLLTTPHQEGVGEKVRQVDIVNRQARAFDEQMQEATAGSGVSGRKPSCGLSFVASKIREHYKITGAMTSQLSLLVNRPLHWQSILTDWLMPWRLKVNQEPRSSRDKH